MDRTDARLDHQVLLDSPALMERRVTMVHLERKANRDWHQRPHQAQMLASAVTAAMDPPAHLVNQVNPANQETKAPQANPAIWANPELQDPQALQDPMDHPAHQAKMVIRDRKETMRQLAQRENQELREIKVPPARKDLQAHLETQHLHQAKVVPVSPARRVPQAHPDQADKRAHQESPAQLDPTPSIARARNELGPRHSRQHKNGRNHDESDARHPFIYWSRSFSRVETIATIVMLLCSFANTPTIILHTHFI